MISKTILITGCSTGIGRAMAEQLSAQGHFVYATARKVEAIADLKSDTCMPLPLDVDDSEQIARVIEHVAAEKGALDVLVNNAGYGAMGPVSEMAQDQLQAQFQTNVFAPMELIRQAVPLLRMTAAQKTNVSKTGGAQILNIGSVSGELTTPFSGAYGASKAALHALSNALRMELAPFGIHVMTVKPGAVSSEFGANAAAALEKILVEDSWYRPVVTAIEGRARITSGSKTTPDIFAQKLIKAMFSETPPIDIYIGESSQVLKFMSRWVPTKIVDRILSKKFALNTLKSRV